MRTLITVTCLTLVAGVAFATLAPSTPVVEQELLTEAPFQEIPNIMPTPQANHCEPSIGSCGSLILGTCDCDVPVVIGTCFDINGRNWFVTDCGHPVDYCAITSYCAPD